MLSQWPWSRAMLGRNYLLLSSVSWPVTSLHCWLCPRSTQVSIIMSVITTLLLLTPTLSLAQHNSRIQDLVESLKNSPRHQSISPSYTSDRKFDVIGSGELPLQSSSSLDDSLLPDIIDRYDKYPGDDDHDNVEDETVVDKDSVGSDSAPFMAPLSVQLTDTESKDEGRKSFLLTSMKKLFNATNPIDPLLSQGSRPRRISRPSGPKPYRRRQQHYQKHGHSAPGLRLRNWINLCQSSGVINIGWWH